jgi:amino acid adenylation domain-containing protein
MAYLDSTDPSELTDLSEEASTPEGIAIVGMAGRFPGASDLDAFWRNLRDGVESIVTWSREELAAAGHEPALLDDPRLVAAAGVLPDIEMFDASFFGFRPREAEAMDPQQRLFLEVAWEALENAGYDTESYGGSIGAFAGMGMINYLLRHVLAHPQVLVDLGPLQTRILTDKDFLTSLAAFKMNLTGPSINVQTACSTSLVATVLACQSLVTYQCDAALAGGVTILLPQAGSLAVEGVSSPDGHCRTFDARSQGTVQGNGAGVVVLKRLADAIADGDTIHAVIKGFATNNDGSFKMGYTAPGIDGQIQVVAMAQAVAGIRGDSISYVEAHGTGTPLGDPIEVEALTEVFRSATDRTGYCALGSVKSNIGHLDTAAGIASLIKTTLALKNRQIPPSLGFEIPNPQIDFPSTPFYVNTQLRDWTTDGVPRRAGVSSFAIGGVNAHVVLEEAPAVPPGDPAAPWQLLVLSAKTETALETATHRLAEHLRERLEADMADIAYTLQVGRRAFRHRRALICRNREDALAALEARDPRRLLTSASESREARLAFLFPGLGNHHVGMARDLYREEPRFRKVFDECADLLTPELGVDLRTILWPEGVAPLSQKAGVDLRALLGRGDSEESPAEAEAARRLRRTELAQPAVFAVEYALSRLLMDLGMEPEAMLGFSVGEYVAACLSGVLGLPDALRLVARRAKLIAELPTGAMLAVPLSEVAAGALLGTELSVSAVLGPELTVLAGPEAAVAAVEARLAGEGLQVRRLETEHAFHSRMMEPIVGRFRELFRSVVLRKPEIPFLSNVTGTWITPEQATSPGYWADHLVKAVRFADGVAELWREPGRALVEAGPGQTLTSWALQHPAFATARDGVAVATMRHALDRQDDQAFLLTGLARLWLAGVRMDWNAFWAGQRRLRVALPTYPFERQRYWLTPGMPAMMTGPVVSEMAHAPLGARAVTSLEEDARKRVPAGMRGRPELPVAFAEPRDEVERLIALVWRDLLGLDRIGIYDGFFDLGGDSLHATKLVTRLNEAFAAGLTLRAVFEKPTVADLAAAVVAKRGEGVRTDWSIPKIPRDGGPLPVSFAQRRLWFLDQLAPGDPFYNVPAAAELFGPVLPEVLGRCLQEIVRRHETLRTRLVQVDGEPYQVVEPPPTSWTVPLVDLRGLPAERAEAEGRQLARAEARTTFDLGRAPMLRALLLRMEASRHIICVTMHHVVSDGWSNAVFLAEMAELHQAYLEGRPSPLPELVIQYADFAAWQLDQLERGLLAEQLDWWREHLKGLPPALELPTDRPRPPVQSFGGARIVLEVAPEIADRLRSRAREEGATLYMLLLAAMDVLLYRHAGQSSFAVGTPVANRTRRETEPLIGFFTNTLVLRADVRPEETFREFLRRTRDTARQAFQHQDLPFEKLVEELQPRRDLSRTPFFQVMMVETLVERSTLAALGVKQLEIDPGVARFDFLFDMSDQGEEISGVLEYNSDLFDASTAERMIRRWLTLLEALALGPEARVGEVRLLPAEEWNVIVERADGGASHPHSLPPGRGGDGPALIGLDGAETSYAELHARANQLAHWLQRQGVGPDVRVALSLERSTELLVSMLAILEAGGAYVPLDPEYPAERRAFMLADSGAALLLTRPGLAAEVPAGVRVVDVGGLDVSAESTEALGGSAGPDNLAYVLYTSGSTGRPKGVAMVRRALDNLIAWQVSNLPGAWRTLQFTSLNFDVSYQEIFSTWAAGGTVVLISEEDRRDPEALLGVLREREVERLFLPFVALQQLAEAARVETRLPSRLREVITAGEQLRITPALAEMFHRLPGARLHNHYGPTESHVMTFFTLEGDPEQWPALPPIGRPFTGTRAVVLDPQGGPAPIGVPGELFLGGVCLARCYLNRPDITAERFVPDPLGGEGSRLYRTGDRARLRADGEIEFLGRLDDQVKIRGYRVEPGAIEAVLATHSGVAEAAVAVREVAEGDRRLVAWVVPHGEKPADLRAFLAARLAEYEVPSALVFVDLLPLTPSGKVDRRKLAALAAPEMEDETRQHVAPRTPTEEILTGIWREVLDLPRLGVVDDFFALGGHSLLATRITARVRAAFGVSLPIRDLFEAPTVARLAERIDAAARSGEVPQAPPLLPVPRGGDFPLSFAQRRLWFLQTLDPESAAYNMPGAFRLTGRLDAAALAGALREIARRHEALRTTFHISTGSVGCAVRTPPPSAAERAHSAPYVPLVGEPIQRIAPEPALSLPLVDLEGLSVEVREVEARRLAEQEGRRPFDLEKDALLRTVLLRLEADEHLLTTTMNHVVGDGWSLGVLVREMVALYPALAAGERPVLPELPVQMVDYAVWQRQWLQGEALQRLLAWWRMELAGSDSALRLPIDRPRPTGLLRRARTLRFRLPDVLTGDVESLGTTQGATLFMTLLASWETLLHRWSGQGDFTIGSPIANRHPAEIEGVIGCFVNTLALRARVDGAEPFRGLLARVREATLGAYEHQDLPFEALVEQLQPDRVLSRAPVFQTLFTLQNAPMPRLELAGLVLEAVPVDLESPKLDLSLVLERSAAGLEAALEFSEDLFDLSTIARLARHWEILLAGAVAVPETPVGLLPLLTAGERDELLSDWVPAGRPVSGSPLLHERFAEWVLRTPDAPALRQGTSELTYRQLDLRSGQLAAELIAAGVRPGDRVGLGMPRSAEAVVGILGILKAGAAWLTLDPALPRERLALMMADAAISALVAAGASGSLMEVLPQGIPVIPVDLEATDRPATLPRLDLPGSALAYVIYTSGSTGRPKGVLGNHIGAVNLVEAMQGEADLPPGTVCSQWASLLFDASILEIALCWGIGGCLDIVPDTVRTDGVALAAWMEERGVGCAFLAPAVLADFAAGFEKADVPLRLLTSGGEAVPLAPLRALAARRPEAALIDTYGPTETSIVTSYWRFPSGQDLPAWAASAVFSPIGTPYANLRVHLLSPEGEPVPVGVAGELYAAGPYLAHGYLGRPDLTAERFLPDPFTPGAPGGDRMYRTGDLARWRPDGTLELLGRIDFQVKIRGQRIELGEIEATLLRHPGVAEAAVLANERDGGLRLEAYLVPVPGSELAAADLRQLLAASLPDAMIPAAFAVLDALPRTAGDKVDRRKLAAIVPDAGPAADTYAAPRTPQEKVLAEVWAEVLGQPRIGIHDDFFVLGGHSLLATRVVSRIEKLFGLVLPVRVLFERPTVEALAAEVARQGGGAPLPGEGGAMGEGTGVRSSIPRASRDRALPLSFAQERIWFLEQLQPGGTAYHLPAAMDLRGALDPQALAGTLAEILRRHEALRTVFREGGREEGGAPVQRILPPPPAVLPVVDLRGLPAEEREAEAGRIGESWFRRPFDLKREPMLRAALLRLEEDLHRLMLLQHHIASDGWSVGVLIGEVVALYPLFAGLPGGRPLPELPIQYADFAVWQREHLRGEALDSLVEAWRERLAGAPPAIDLPTDRPRPRAQDFHGENLLATYGGRGTAAMASLARTEGATLFMALLAVFQTLLQRWSGEDDVVVGTPVAGRTRPELEGMIGVFINSLALRGRLEGEPTFRELVAQARETALDAYALQELPFETLVGRLQTVRDLARAPIFQTMFALQNAPAGRLELPGLTLEPRMAEAGGAKLELLLSLTEEGGGLAGGLEYNTTLFDRSTAARFLRHFWTLLEAAAAHPDLPVSLLSLLAAEERSQLLGAWADGGAMESAEGPAEELLHARFAALAIERPDAVALTWNGRDLAYGDLAARAWRLARHLRELGAGPEVRVGICLERSPDLVVAILAVLAAGGAYVPIEPGLPAERRAFLVRDTRMPILITRWGLLGNQNVDQVRVLDPGEEADIIAGHDAAPLPPFAAPGNLAYLIYTSGSTGVPKGVAIPHRSAVAFLRWVPSVWSREDLSAVLAATSVSFDLSIFELFAPLSTGGRAVLVENALRLQELVDGGGVTLVNTVPSAMAELMRLGVIPQSLRVVNLAGEPLRRRLVDDLYRSGVPRVLNLYGPSEDTTYSTWAEMAPGGMGSTEPGIGRPIAGTRAYVLDPALEPAPEGVAGELYLAGAGLARGYLDRPDLTAERFVPDPFAGPQGEPGRRLYRTGDRARWRPDGTLEFLGRLDHQVKVRGFRIELGEIEAALLACPGISEAAVLVRDRDGDRRLEACLVAAPGQEPGLSTLRAAVARRLPEHMIPSALVFLPALPHTPTGKVDRRALAQIDTSSGALRREYVEPRSEVEKWLAETCAALLGVEKVGLRDRFFDLGGHSLLATQLIARLREEWRIDLPLQEVFAAVDLGDLATRITDLGLGQAGDDELAAALAELGVAPEDLDSLLKS